MFEQVWRPDGAHLADTSDAERGQWISARAEIVAEISARSKWGALLP